MNPCGVFVYGTLKRGQCRDMLWPAAPCDVVAAWTRGALYSRHDYPAMTTGDDRVMGELWRFDDDILPTVLKVLDEIEETNQPGRPNLYDRVQVQAWSVADRSPFVAWTYRYATDPLTDGFQRIDATGVDDVVRWG